MINELDVTITPNCTEIPQVGESIEYEVTVQNNSDAAVKVSVNDINGGIATESLEVIEPAASASKTLNYEVTEVDKNKVELNQFFYLEVNDLQKSGLRQAAIANAESYIEVLDIVNSPSELRNGHVGDTFESTFSLYNNGDQILENIRVSPDHAVVNWPNESRDLGPYETVTVSITNTLDQNCLDTAYCDRLITVNWLNGTDELENNSMIGMYVPTANVTLKVVILDELDNDVSDIAIASTQWSGIRYPDGYSRRPESSSIAIDKAGTYIAEIHVDLPGYYYANFTEALEVPHSAEGEIFFPTFKLDKKPDDYANQIVLFNLVDEEGDPVVQDFDCLYAVDSVDGTVATLNQSDSWTTYVSGTYKTYWITVPVGYEDLGNVVTFTVEPGAEGLLFLDPLLIRKLPTAGPDPSASDDYMDLALTHQIAGQPWVWP